ncbi:MAG: prefoldin subunit alpha [Thermoplasmata archaeon]
MTQDDKINQIVYSMEILKQQLEEVQDQEQSLSVILQEILSSLNFLRNIGKIEGESLIPIGRGIYVEGTLTNKNKVLVDIGSGAFKKTSIEDAIKILEDRREEITGAIENARKSEEEIQRRYLQLDDYLNRIYQK